MGERGEEWGEGRKGEEEEAEEWEAKKRVKEEEIKWKHGRSGDRKRVVYHKAACHTFSGILERVDRFRINYNCIKVVPVLPDEVVFLRNGAKFNPKVNTNRCA